MSIPATTTLYRLDLFPSLDLFPIDITAQKFQTYKCHSISYKLLPRFNISSLPGTLPVTYTVPVQSNQVPAPSPAAFTAFADCVIEQWSSTKTGSYVPLMYQDDAETSSLVRSPVFSTSFKNRLMYGHSILISKPATTVLDFILVMALRVSLYDFDDTSLALTRERYDPLTSIFGRPQGGVKVEHSSYLDAM